MRLSLSFVGVLVLGLSGSALATTFTSTGTGGNWNVGTTWGGACAAGCTAGVDFPGAGDIAVISSGATVTVNITTAACTTLTMNGTAILNFTGSNILAISGTMTMNGTSSVTGNSNNQQLNLNGDFIIPSSNSGSIGGVRVTQPNTKNFTVAGTFTPSSNTGTKSIGNLIMAQTGSWNATSNETFTVQGSATFNDGCLLSGSSTATIIVTGTLTVQPTVGGLHSKVGQITLTINGTTTINGYLEFANSNAGGKTFNNTITVNPGGTWDDTIGEDPVINCNIVNNGSWPNPTGGTGQYSVSVTGNYTYSGNSSIGMTILRINSTATVTNTTTLNLTSTGTGNNAPLRLTVNGATFNNGNGTSGYLYFSGSTDPLQVTGITSSANFSAANNTVEYSRLGAQNIYTTGTSAYYNLICSGNATKTMPGSTIVNNALTIQGSTTVDVSGGIDLTGTGNLIMNGTSTLRLSSAGTVPALTGGANVLNAGTTIEFYRGGVQTAASSATYPYQNMLISGAGGNNVNLSNVTSIQGNLTVNNFGLFNSNATLNIAGNFTYSSSSATPSILSNNITTASFLGTSGQMDFTTNNKKMFIAGDGGLWKNTGLAFTGAGPNVEFNTGVGQEIQGPTITTFGTLTINNTNDDVTLNGIDATIATSLVFTNGNLVTGSQFAIAGPSVPVTASAATGWVQGNFRRLVNTTSPPTLIFPVGTTKAVGQYAPVSLTLTGVTNTVGFITVSTSDDDSPDIFSGLFEQSRTVNRYWSIRNSDGATAAVNFTSADGVLNFDATDPDTGLDFTKAAIRAYNNTALSWSDVAVSPITYTATSASFFAYAGGNFVQNQLLDFEIGQTILPISVYNRKANSSFNWSDPTTWIQYRSGSIQTVAGNPNVLGFSTKFTTELKSGDVIMLVTDPGGTGPFGVATVNTITDDTHMTLTAGAGSTVNPASTFGRQHVPGNCSGCAAPDGDTDTDAVTIGNSFLGNTGQTTIIYDAGVPAAGFKVATLDVNTAGSPITFVQALTHATANPLNIVNVASVNQAGNNNQTTLWDLGAIGIVRVQGDINIGTGTSGSNNTTRRAQISMSGATSSTIQLSTNNLKFKLQSTTLSYEAQAILTLSNNATIAVSGSLTSNNPTRGGTLTGSATSTVIFNRTAGIQTLFIPSAAVLPWAYGNVVSENTNINGLTISTNVNNARVIGNIEVHNGAFLRMSAAAQIAGDPTKSFIVAPGGTFETLTTGANKFPTGFGTFDLGTTAPYGNVYYNIINAGPTLATVNYGNLFIMNQGTATFTNNRTFSFPATTITVSGSLTIGDGINAFVPTVAGTGGASIVDVRGNLSILGGTLTLANIPTLKVGGNWVNNSTFTPSTGTVEFSGLAGTGNQTIGGSSASTFSNVRLNTLNTTDLVQVTKNMTVSTLLTLTQGGLNLVDPTNVGRTLTISSNATTAITRAVSDNGYIKNEKIISAVSVPYGTVQWNIALATGSYVFPFGRSSTEYIPFTLNKTTAGTGGTSFSVSTYGTFNTQNQPYPPTVVNLTGAGDSNGSGVADRFWLVTPNGYTTNPSADMTFTITNSERVSGNPNLNAQRWNPSNYWDPAFPACGSGSCYTNSTSTTVKVMAVTNFPTPWAVTDVATPLPIQLTDFTAQYRAGLVAVEWKTESEVNNDFFLIQRSADAEVFEDVMQVKGAGTSTTPKSYSTFDYQPRTGKWYYRLKQTDTDGSFTYSKLVAVTVPENLMWTVFPNPSSGKEFNVNFNPEDVGKSAFVKVQDIGGKELLQLQFENLTSSQMKVELPQQLTAGVYVISIAVDQRVVRQKLVIR